MKNRVSFSLLLKVCFYPTFILLVTLLGTTAASAQDSLIEYRDFVTPPNAPAAPGSSFTAPTWYASPNANTPVFAEWTRTALKDESIVATGMNFSAYSGTDEGMDARVIVCNGNGNLHHANIQRLERDKAIFTLAKNDLQKGFKLIWAANENGFGRPVAINKAEAWWVGPEICTAGSVTAVFGRNLSQNNDTLAGFVYLFNPLTNAGVWAETQQANPFRIQFKIPAGTTPGNYQVWVHNGSGGNYGWSKPVTLTVEPTPLPNILSFDVRSFGAFPNDGVDDWFAINAAMTTASLTPNATVYFPAGTFEISATLFLRANLIYKGEGINTTIKPTSNFPANAPALIAARGENVRIKNLSFITGSSYQSPNSSPLYFWGARNLVLENIRTNFVGHNILNLDQSYNTKLKNCEFTGRICFLGNASQLFIDSCLFKQTNDAELALHLWGGRDVAITNSICKDLDNSNSNDGTGWGKGRFFVATGNFGSTRNTYLGNNKTIDLGVRHVADVDPNSGEQFLWEGFMMKWSGRVNGATANTFLGSGANYLDTLPKTVAIIRGKGLGQVREISWQSGSNYQISQPWNIIPDSTSHLVMGSFATNTVVYKNDIDGKIGNVTMLEPVASSGIQPFGATFNFIADNNKINEVRFGIANWETQHSIGLDANFFNTFSNNKISNCRWAIQVSLINQTVMGKAMIGNLYRGNQATGTLQSGILYSVITNDTTIIDACVLEHNNLAGTKGVSTGGDLGLPTYFPNASNGATNQFFYKNKFTSSTNTGTNAGIRLTNRVVLRENEYVGYNTSYQSDNTGSTLEAPSHVIRFVAEAQQDTIRKRFVIWNAGSRSLTWSASSNVPWVISANTNGTILSEADSSEVEVTFVTRNLPVGTHKAKLFFDYGGKRNIYLVTVKKMPLPVNPIALSVQLQGNRQNNHVALNWSVNYFENTSGFEIQKATHSTTGFNTVATSPSHASSTTANFQSTLTDSTTVVTYYRIKFNDRDTVKYSNVVSIDAFVMPVPPPPVISLQLSGSRQNTQVELNWTVNQFENTTGFNIQRSTQSSTGFTTIANTASQVTTTAATYQSTVADTSSVITYYRIQYNDRDTVKYSNSISIEAYVAPAPPPPPAISLLLSGNRQNTQVALNWTVNQFENTRGFAIQKSQQSSSGFYTITNTTSTASNGPATYQSTLNDTSSVITYYRIQYYDRDTLKVSNVVSIEAYVAPAPPPPPALPVLVLQLTGNRQSNQVALNWTTNFFENDRGFEVQQSQQQANGFQAVSNVNSSASNTASNYQTTLTDTSSVVTYFRVRYFDRDTVKYSNIISINAYVAPAPPPPAPPVLSVRLQGTRQNTQVALNWAVNFFENTRGFQVQQSLEAGTGFQTIANSSSYISTGAASFDASIFDTTTAITYYRIQYYDRDTLKVSNVVSVVAYMRPVPPPPPPAYTPPVNIQLDGSRQSDRVSLHWVANYFENARGFEIQKSSMGSSFTTIGTTGSQASAGVANFNTIMVDSSSITTYYRIAYYDRDTLKYSNTVSIDALVRTTTTSSPNLTATRVKMGLFPNPVRTTTVLQIASTVNGVAKVSVFNTAGQNIENRNIQLQKGQTSRTTFNFQSLPAGIYFVHVLVGSEVFKLSFFKD